MGGRRRKCDAALRYILKVSNMKTALKLKITLIRDYQINLSIFDIRVF
jgi:hypothetical protein